MRRPRESHRLAAALARGDVDALRILAEHGRRPTVRARAAAALGDEGLLAQIARSAPRPAARRIALKALQGRGRLPVSPVERDVVLMVARARRIGLTDAEVRTIIERAIGSFGTHPGGRDPRRDNTSRVAAEAASPWPAPRGGAARDNTTTNNNYYAVGRAEVADHPGPGRSTCPRQRTGTGHDPEEE